MSEIDWSQLRSVTAREIINALHRDGFSLRNQPAATGATSTPMADG